MHDATLVLVELAQGGSTTSLDQLIREQQPFIQKTTSHICKRNVQWDQDDELSIALIAFHEAVQKYNPNKGAHFLTFARQVIHQRLIDFFRKEQRHQHLPLYSFTDGEEEKEISSIETEKAIETHQQKTEQEELATTLEDFEQRLLTFGITMDDLVEASPKHRDTRENLLRVALHLSSSDELLESLMETRRLPVADLVKQAKVSRRVLEKGRKYIIALAIIISENQFSSLKYFAGIDDF
ncbi:RNA polymerase sigma-I factor [Tepidibacillus fermentans]|uniref:RNA polymerase sigma factor SigI n=1 Tax=Tepidibacillus fermentans TaxID=1281767 RepID=A0A4R3KAG4_9BACI|nr:RNA polymerase sigma-I factor [Tepidibacillus fermentans]TCS79899.1 RNA polymerase sigma factor [Tepidibacillus fermentans]